MLRLRVLIFVAAAALGAAASEAIIIRHDVKDARYRELGEKYRPMIVQLALTTGAGVPALYNGMGTLIAPEWVLTAGHAAWVIPGAPEGPVPARPHYVFVEGRGYLVKEVLFPPVPQKMVGDKYALNDIALVRLAKAVPNARTACLYRKRDEAGRSIILAGMGVKGDGVTGVGSGDGALRGAMQRIDGVGEGNDPNVLWYDFDKPGSKRALPLEGIAGPGDSGGPAFVEERGRTCLIGVGAGQDSKGGPEGLYGVREYYTRVSQFVPWIEQVISQHASP